MKRILNIIKGLDDLPADHEPDTEDLWDAIRRIQTIATATAGKTVTINGVKMRDCAALHHDE